MCIWVNHGEADHSRYFEAPRMALRESWATVSAAAKTSASFDLLADNSLEISRETFLHNGSIGAPKAATLSLGVEADEEILVVRF